MGVIEGRTWLETLSPPECWRLLAENPVGRIGVVVDGAPEIYPVNHVVEGDTIVFRTDKGSKLRGLDRSPSVCYQVDSADPERSTGWSVLVKGRAVEMSKPEELKRVATLPLTVWAIGDKARWIRIVSTEVTGRRVRQRPEA